MSHFESIVQNKCKVSLSSFYSRSACQYWGCTEHLCDNFTRTEVALGSCETILPKLRLPWATLRQIYQEVALRPCEPNLPELRLLWTTAVRQSFQNWGCSEHLWDNFTRTEVAMSTCETILLNLRLLWAPVRQSYQNWGCSEHLKQSY